MCIRDRAGVALSARVSGYQSVLAGVSMASLAAGYTRRTVVGLSLIHI